jgi:hypothetical protein
VEIQITQGGKKAAASVAAIKTTSGVFTGILEGDYSHWKMTTEKGEEVSYFILKPDASIERALENPKPFIGKKCVVKWKASKENLPEAGGKIEVEQVISVEWK